jgi:hypothetical protein
MGTYSTTFIYVKNVVVLMYFIVEGRIDTFGEEIQPSDWLKLSEARSVRARAGAAAVQRINTEFDYPFRCRQGRIGPCTLVFA